jgi:hypothetical protein
MSIDINSFTGQGNSLVQTGFSLWSGKENYRSGLRTDIEPDVSAKEREPSSVKDKVSGNVSFTTDHQVDFKTNPNTHEIVIQFLDKESGEVIQQFSGEDFLKLTHRIAEFNQNFLDQTP